MFTTRAPFGKHPYPSPKPWIKLQSVGKRDLYRFARLWLTEGLPFAFRQNPMSYEKAREKLARNIDDDPKHVCVTGSARIGFSLNPASFGRPFGSHSDLDLFIVSANVFDRLAMEANLFVDRFEKGLAIPRNSSEERFWPGNKEILQSQITRGFVSHWLIPHGDYYPFTAKASRGLTQFNYAVTGVAEGGRIYRRSTLRVYKNWDVAIAQIGGSVVKALQDRGCTIVPSA